MLAESPEEMLAMMQQMDAPVRELVQLTIDFGKAFAEKKREDGIIDFADMEHFALQILVTRDEDGNSVPSATAKELQEYYEEIMTDEYQDSNYVQEMILTSISRGPEQSPYLFMVGDVKQSIYQFRLARPDLLWRNTMLMIRKKAEIAGSICVRTFEAVRQYWNRPIIFLSGSCVKTLAASPMMMRQN